MLSENTVRVLEFLEPLEPGDRKDLSPLLNEIIPLGPQSSLEVYFIDVLKEYVNFNHQYTRTLEHGFVQFMGFLKKEGRIALAAYRESKLQEKAHKSSIDVNESIIATNRAIDTTNQRMLEHAETQEAMMKTQSGFMERQAEFSGQQVGIMDEQKKLVEKQNTLYKVTLFLTGANILVAIVLCIATLSSNSDKELLSTQQQQLTDKDKEIKRLQLLKSDTVHYVLHYPALKSKLKNK